MEEFVVYILYSERFNKNCTGFTSNLIERFKSHNYLGTKGFTLKFRPWTVIYVKFFYSKSDAMKREKSLIKYYFFKKQKTKKILHTVLSSCLIKIPNLVVI